MVVLLTVPILPTVILPLPELLILVVVLLLVLFMILVVLFVTLTFEPNPVKPGRLSNSSSISLAIES